MGGENEEGGQWAGRMRKVGGGREGKAVDDRRNVEGGRWAEGGVMREMGGVMREMGGVTRKVDDGRERKGMGGGRGK